MRDFSVGSGDFVALLDALPQDEVTLRQCLMDTFRVLVGDGTPPVLPYVGVHSGTPAAWAMWLAIETARGEEGAADVVSELVLSKGGRRIYDMIEASVDWGDVFVRADDPELARLIFYPDGEQQPVGEYIVDYYRRSGRLAGEFEDDDDLIDDDDTVDSQPEESGQPAHVELELADLISGKPRPSAMRGADWTLERIQTATRGFLTVPEDWKEADLEQFLWVNWGKIDFGLDRPVYLIDRQVRLGPGTDDRVDFVARGASGEWIAVELKIKEATRGILTQLLSYMADLERRGESPEEIRGILIAPGFASKVTNAASTDPRITLLRFNIGQ